MILSPQAIRLLLNDPADYNLNRKQLITRDKKERLLIKYLFERDKVEEDFILNVEAPSNPIITKAIKFVVEEVQRVLDDIEVLEPVTFNGIVRDVAEISRIPNELLLENLEKYKEYFEFCNARRKKTVISKNDVDEIYKFNDIQNGPFTRFGQIFKSETYREKVKPLKLFKETHSVFDSLFEKNQLVENITQLKGIRESVKIYRGKKVAKYFYDATTAFECDIDGLDYNETTKETQVYLIKLVNKSIKEVEDLVFSETGLFIEIAVLYETLQSYLESLNKDHKPILHLNLYLIDSKGYDLLVTLEEKTVLKCVDKFNKTMDLIHWQLKHRIFNTYAKFGPKAQFTL